jgi:hypothetical protein
MDVVVLTKVESAKFVAIAEKLGLKVSKQSSNYRVEDESGTKRLYVPTTAKCHRIDISGFTHELGVEWSKAFPGKAPPTGKVLQVVNFAQEEKLVLKDFFMITKSISKAQDAELPAESTEAAELTTAGELAEENEAAELSAEEQARAEEQAELEADAGEDELAEASGS